MAAGLVMRDIVDSAPLPDSAPPKPVNADIVASEPTGSFLNVSAAESAVCLGLETACIIPL